MFLDQQNKENTEPLTHHRADLDDDKHNFSLFDSPSSSASPLLLDKQQTEQEFLIILDDDDNEIEIDETLTNTCSHEKNDLKNLIPILEVDTELILVKSNVPIRICTAALPYVNLLDTYIILVNHSLISSPECIIKRQLYMSKPSSLSILPIRTRIYHRLLSTQGFIYEQPCSMTNLDRYLVIYDNYTAAYQLLTDFHLCLCQDFAKHLSNIDCLDLRAHYQHLFHHTNRTSLSKLSIGQVIQVRKFGVQFHNARIIDQDCSLIKVCFFERKSQTEMWLHSNSSMIQFSDTSMILFHSNRMHLPKRKSHLNHIDEGKKKLRDRSNSKPLDIPQRQSSSSSDETPAASRANMLNVYYTDILQPRFRLQNNLPYIGHKCSSQCVALAEENFSGQRIYSNPFLIPFECHWSIVDGKPRGYRTPCRRTFYSLDDIEKYLYRTNSKIPIQFFIDDLLTRFTPSIERFDEQHKITNDLANGQENIRIPVYNDINDDRPDHFTYVTEVRPFDSRIHAALNDTNMTSCCDCTDNCSDRMKCACFRKTLNQALLNQDPLVMEKQKNRHALAQISKMTGYQRKRLLNPVSSGIYECNSKCSCHSKHCSNRLVQQGLFVQLQLFKDKHKGWGLRTLHDIPRGTFICQYIGELITSDQGHERAQTMDDKYQTSLDLVKQIYYETHDEEMTEEEEEEEPYVIDGSLFSNLGKYFNHSCDPNMYIQNVFIESHDLHFPNLALFTRTRVKAGEELTWHYNCELLPDREVKCFCGAKTCRGRLF